jgi:hypothetical protein
VSLARCGDLLDAKRFTFCGRLAPPPGSAALRGTVDGADRPLQIRANGSFEVTLPREENRSGPLQIWQGERPSNAVWLSLQQSAVVAALPDETVKTSEGITTYVDLLSIVIEEPFDALPEARRLAGKYQAHVVGAIPP